MTVVMLRVMLARFARVVLRVKMVPMRDMGVMSCLVVITLLVMLRRVAVVFGGVLVMLRRFAMVISSLMSGHAFSRRVRA